MYTKGQLPFLHIAKLLVLLLAVDAVFFAMVNPDDRNSFIVIIASVLVALTVYIVFRLLLRAVTALLPLRLAVQRRLSVSAAGLIVFVLLMQSIGQLTARDVLAVVPLIVVGYFYLSYTSKQERRLDDNHTRV